MVEAGPAKDQVTSAHWQLPKLAMLFGAASAIATLALDWRVQQLQHCLQVELDGERTIIVFQGVLQPIRLVWFAVPQDV
jgi:hypothetical protein